MASQFTLVEYQGKQVHASRVVEVLEFRKTTTQVREIFPESGKTFSVPSVLNKFSIGDRIFQELDPDKKRFHWKKIVDKKPFTKDDSLPSGQGSKFSIKDVPKKPIPAVFVVSDQHWKGAIYCLIRTSPLLITGYSGTGKTTLANLAAYHLGRSIEVFNMGATQDPRTTLVGVTQLNSDGTIFRESRFVKACITPNTVILLDEITRANPDAWNILIPALDGQRYIALDESETGERIDIHPTVSFVATANMGIEFTSTSTLDRAVLDRFHILELPFITEIEEAQLFTDRTGIDSENAKIVAEICHKTRQEHKSNGKLSTPVSTRAGLQTCEMIVSGFELSEAAEFCISPFYSDDGDDSERTFIKQLLQKYVKVSSNNTYDEKENKDDGDVPFPNL